MKEYLKELLYDQLKIEQDSIILYKSFIDKIEDDSIKLKLDAILKSEVNHVEIVKNMISLIENESNKIMSIQTDNINLDLSGFLNEYGNLHIHTKIDNYSETIKKLIKTLNMPLLYISYNKILKYTKAFLEKENINLEKIKFITCINNDDDENYINPESLTDISIEIGSFLEENSKCAIIIDSISGFSIYYNNDEILKFVTSINSKFQSGTSGPIWISIGEEADSEFIEKIASTCNKSFDI